MNSLLKAAQTSPPLSDPRLAEKAKQMLKTNQEWSALSSLAKKAKERKNMF